MIECLTVCAFMLALLCFTQSAVPVGQSGEVVPDERSRDGKNLIGCCSRTEGGQVKGGGHVSVVIGKFRADGLVVD